MYDIVDYSYYNSVKRTLYL